MERIAYVADT